METTNDLIKKFFEKECNPEETEAVATYLSCNPEKLDKYFPVKEWNEIEQNASLPENCRIEMLEYSKGQLFGKEDKAKIIRVTAFKWTAIAASLLCFAVGARYIAGRTSSSKKAETASRRGSNKDNKEERPLTWITQPNRTGRSIKLFLPDGSLVNLANNSSLRYRDSFGVKKRELWLDGQAFFSVVKRSKCPFTVFSGALATTALGTAFDVSAPGTGNRSVHIKLYTGKVVVKSTGHLAGWEKDIYLLPGEEVSYDTTRMLASVGQFRKSSLTAKEEVTSGEDLEFNNSSLKKVMEKLSFQYHTKIIYKDSDLSGMNFTGTVSHSDSLNVFLKLLATMNGLELQEQEPVFIVTKPKGNE